MFCFHSQPPALRSIDLTLCVADRLELAGFAELFADENCPAPSRQFRQAISIECLQQEQQQPDEDNGNATVEYVISSSACNDLSVWVRELNRVLEFVRDWRL